MSPRGFPPTRLSRVLGALCSGLFLLPGKAAARLIAHSPFEASVDLREEENFRIRRHLARVEMDLRLHPPEGMSPAQREARARRLDDLRAYRIAGVFPVNPSLLDTLHPIFLDGSGTACAVGQLVIASGSRALAEEIAATRNHAYIPDIDDPRLAAWAAANGLTLEECARIQPSYFGSSWSRVRSLSFDARQLLWIGARETSSPTHSDAVGALGQGAMTQGFHVFGFRQLCLSRQGQVFVTSAEGALWQDGVSELRGLFALPMAPPAFSCSWIGDSVVWAGAAPGLIRFRPQPGIRGPVLADAMGRDLFGGDTVRWVIPFGDSVLAGSESGLAVSDTAGKVWTSVSPLQLDGKVTGIVADGNGGFWIGVDGRRTGDRFPRTGFSSEGLIHRAPDGTWKGYRAFMSSVLIPGDTLDAILPQPSGALLIACSRELYEFTPPLGLRKLGGTGELQINALAGDTATLYLGTETGLYRWKPQGPEYLGYLTATPSRLAPGGNRVHPVRPAFGWPSVLPGKTGTAAATLLGRRVGARPAAGILVARPESPARAASPPLE